MMVDVYYSGSLLQQNKYFNTNNNIKPLFSIPIAIYIITVKTTIKVNKQTFHYPPVQHFMLMQCKPDLRNVEP